MLNVRLEVLLFVNDVVGLLKFHKPIYTQTLPMPFIIPIFFLELPSQLVVPMAHCGHLQRITMFSKSAATCTVFRLASDFSDTVW